MDILDYFFPDKYINNINHSYSSDLLCDLYAPKNLNDFMDNKQNIKIFKSWINKNNNETGFMISGVPGSGKTTLAKLMCNVHKIRYIHCEASCKRTKKELNDLYDKIKFSNSKIIIIDELDSGSNGEQICMSTLLSWVDKKCKIYNIKVIFITNSYSLNKVSDLINHCEHIKINIPSNKMLFSKCLQIIDNENIDVDINSLKKYISNYNGDVRSIINNLFNMNIVSYKDINLSLFQVYETLFKSKISLSQKMVYFSFDAGTIPIIIQENYIDWDTSPEVCIDIVNSMSLADIYHHSSFFKHNNLLYNLTQDSYCVLSSLFPICISNKKYNANDHIRFGSIWTKLSTMYQRRKYLRNIINSTHIHNATSLSFFRTIALSQIVNDEIDVTRNLFSFYNVPCDYLNDIYKMFIFPMDMFPKFPVLKKKFM